jgi:hypothetical protein
MKDITRCLLEWGERKPDAPAFAFASREGAIVSGLTYGELLERTSALAGYLRSMYQFRVAPGPDHSDAAPHQPVRGVPRRCSLPLPRAGVSPSFTIPPPGPIAGWNRSQVLGRDVS